ncbi:histidine kinase [Evansella sp. AB-P1]|uniref:histidine kinase n=1 Tax=Evansella sp. AB-P1 TaxID=3037653 RepID=UPI00241FAE1E|nr:histidine kinase [Evansella sp. AB-P1]MDG5786096.1 histidine kinase [Evansella sp. AB-P1]
MKRIRKKIIDFLSGCSIHMKIYGMVFAVIFIVTFISLIVVRISISDTLSLQLDERVKSIGSDVASKSSDFMLTNNIYALQKLVNDKVDNHTDIEYVFILNEHDRILVHSYENMDISQELLKVNLLENTDDINLIQIDSEEGIIRDVAVPIVKGIGGTARVGLRNDSLDEALHSVTTQLLMTMMVVLILSVLIVLGLTRVITLPIKKLVDLTKLVSQGDFSKRVNNYPKDEIGKLTQSFNIMLTDLEKTQMEKEEYLNKIVSRNKELTLLHDISGTITNYTELKRLLEQFVIHLVEELSLNSALIKVNITGQVSTFSHSMDSCPVNDQDIEQNQQPCTYCRKGLKVFNTFSLRNKQEDIGKLQICSKNQLDPYTAQVLNSIAKQLSVTIENIKLWVEIKKKEEIRLSLLEKIMTVQEEERKRIARELHDQTSHSLSSILLGLKLLQETKTDIAKHKEINKLRELTHQAIEEVHDLAWQLRPTILDKFGLEVAIERYIEEFTKKYPVEFEIIINGIKVERLRPEIETAIFRIVQESLTNILKYAEATSISVIVMKHSHMISVIIEDDGVGFNVEKVLNKDPSKYNLGLRGMQERVTLLGGTLNIESADNEGTAIMVKIPTKDKGRDLLAN